MRFMKQRDSKICASVLAVLALLITIGWNCQAKAINTVCSSASSGSHSVTLSYPMTDKFNSVTIKGRRYSVGIIMTSGIYIKPGTPDYNIDSLVKGNFSVESIDSAGKVVSVIPLNQFWGGNSLTFGACVECNIGFYDYIGDGNRNFFVSQYMSEAKQKRHPGSDSSFIVFSINKNGTIRKSHVKGGYVYGMSMDSSDALKPDEKSKGCFYVVRAFTDKPWCTAKYVWQNGGFVEQAV